MASEQDVIESLGIKITSNASGATKSLNTLNKRLERLITNLTTVQSKTKNTNINIGTQAEQTAKSTNNATKSLNNYGSATSRATSKSKNLAYAFGKFYANCFLAIRGIKKLGSAIESSMDYIETYNYFNVTMDKIGKEWNKDYSKWGYDNAEAYEKSFQNRIEALNTKLTGYTLGENGEATYTGEKNLGMNIEQMMNFQASVGAVTNSLGIMGETSVNTQKAMSMLATDLSSFKNIDINSVMTNLQSGLIGQSRSLYRFGVDITNATLQTYAYANGITKAITEMTQGEKMQLRLLAILDQSKIAWGDQANTVNSVANQYRILKEQFGNLSRTIGSIFIPIVEKVLPIINGLVIGMNKLLQTFGISVWGDSWLSDIMSGTSAGYSDDALGDLADDSEDLADGLEASDKNAKKLKNNLLGIDKLNIISPQDNSSASSGSGTSTGSGIDLSNQIATAVSDYEKVWEKAFKNSENLAQKYADKIVKAFESGDWESVGKYWSKKLENTLKNINWNNVYDKAKGFGKGLAEFLNGLIKPETFYQVGKTVANSLNTAIKAKLSFGQTFDWENLGVSIASGINGFFENYDFVDLAETINVWVQGIWTTFATAILKVKWGKALNGIGKFLGNLEIKTIGLIIGSVVIKKILGMHLLSAVGSKLEKNLINKLTPVFKNVGKVLGGVLAGVAEFGIVSTLFRDLRNGATKLTTSIFGIGTAVAAAAAAFKVAFGLSGPVAAGISIAIGAIGLLVGEVQHMHDVAKKAYEEELNNLIGLSGKEKALQKEIKKTSEEYKDMRKACDDEAESIEKQYSVLEAYKDQLDDIVDSNGKIKKGYEEQAQALLNELNPQLGTNAKIVNGQIDDYKTLSKQIDITIQKKKAEAMIDAYGTDYAESRKNEQRTLKNAKDTYDIYKNSKKAYESNLASVKQAENDMANAQEKLNKARKENNEQDAIIAERELENAQKRRINYSKLTKGLKDNMDEQEGIYNKALDTYSSYATDVVNYEEMLAASQSNNAERMETATNNMINQHGKQMTRMAADAYIKGGEVADNIGDGYTAHTKKVKKEVEKSTDEMFKSVTKCPGDFMDVKGFTDNIVGGFSTIIANVKKEVKNGDLQKGLDEMWESLFGKEISFTPEIIKNGSKLITDMDKDKFTFKMRTYATGGFPEDGWFRASKGEYFGQFDDGTSYISNNKQIEGGIASGVESAAYRGMLRAIAQNNSQASEQTIVVQSVLDGKVIAKSTNRYNSRRGSNLVKFGSSYN